MKIHRSQTLFENEEDSLSVSELCKSVCQKEYRLVPSDRMRQAKSWIEVIKQPPVPLKNSELYAMHGWLSPAGELYACGWKKHNELNEALGFVHESVIEEAGFCKLTDLKWLVHTRYHLSEITEKQWHTIALWYELNGFPEQHFVRLTQQL